MDSNITESKKRPGLVWAISIFYFFSGVFALFLFYLVYSGKLPLSSALKTQMEGEPLQLGLMSLPVLTNTIGAGLLFLLRKQAFYFFAIAPVAGLLGVIWRIVSKGFFTAMPAGSLFRVSIAVGISIAICIYIKKLEKAGVLR